jgi:hypothetical protein
VRQVDVTRIDDHTAVSRWEVNFRSGILRWTEEDTFDAITHVIRFRQLEGDVALFDGSWRCHDTADGAMVIFAARLDMGIPTLADALEPIAVRTLVDNTVAIVTGLFSGAARLLDLSADLPVPSAGRAGSGDAGDPRPERRTGVAPLTPTMQGAQP